MTTPEGFFTLTATAEVRDKDGNLKDTVEITQTVSEEQLRALTEGDSQ